MSGHKFLLVLSMTGAVACGTSSPQPPQDQPRHPLLDKLTPPPLNRPVAAVPIPVDGASLSPGSRPALLLLSEGRPFRGTVTRAGRVTTRAGRIDFVSEGQTPIQVLYRLPEGLPAIAPSEVNGSATLVERSSPAGPDRLVIVRSNRSLLLAHVWMKSASRVIAELGDGLCLVQRTPPAAPPGQPAAESRIELLDDAQVVSVIPRAKPTRIQTRVGAFEVLVETNRLTYSSESDRQGDAYVLKAWVVRSEP